MFEYSSHQEWNQTLNDAYIYERVIEDIYLSKSEQKIFIVFIRYITNYSLILIARKQVQEHEKNKWKMELYSQSIWILGWLSLHTQTKFQNKTKTKLHKFCATSYRYFSLAKFCQLRYTNEKQTWTRNVLWMNTNLKNITWRCGYSGMIFLKTLQVNLSDTCHITPRILFKGRNTKHFIKIGNVFVRKKHF